MSGAPLCEITKCRPCGVIVPLNKWCGVRAFCMRGSPLGLVSVRATFSSKRERCSYGLVIAPGARLHGSFTSVSAAAVFDSV